MLADEHNKHNLYYHNLPSAGPPFKTSLIAIDGSPLAKCGLSLPPLTAIPNP